MNYPCIYYPRWISLKYASLKNYCAILCFCSNVNMNFVDYLQTFLVQVFYRGSLFRSDLCAQKAPRHTWGCLDTDAQKRGTIPTYFTHKLNWISLKYASLKIYWASLCFCLNKNVNMSFVDYYETLSVQVFCMQREAHCFSLVYVLQ